MSFAVVSENILYLRVYFYTVFAACFFYNLDTSERLDCTAQYFVSLQTYDNFIILIDVTGSKRSNG